jgi:hypothetical protein
MRMMRRLDTAHANIRKKTQDVLNYILESETIAGSSFIRSHGQLYIFLGHTKQVQELPFKNPSEDIAGYLDSMYGISQVSPLGRAVYNHFHSHALNQAVNVELRRFAVYRADKLTTYLSAYDGHMWRLDGGTPTRVTNGEDDVFFIDDDGGKHTSADIGPHQILLDTLLDLNYTPGLGGITPEQQRMALTVWLFALAFPDLIKHKPLLMLEGVYGSGKSVSAQLIQLALTGKSKAMIIQKNGEDDFNIQLLRAPIAVFDNTDTYIDWIPDAICSYATDGSWTKRKLYTNTGEIEIKPQAFVVVASKNPASFRRGDTVDRQIIIRLERLTKFKSAGSLDAKILALRPKLLGEYIWYVNEIVEHLRVTNDEVAVEETLRMADFARFVRVVGAVLRWSKQDIEDLLAALASERDAFAAEEDPLLEILHEWIRYRGRGVSSIGRKISISMLFRELQSVAESMDIKNFYKSQRILAQNIRSPAVERDFHVETSIENRQKIFQFWRHTDPRLDVLDGGLSYPPAKTDE